MVRVVQLFQLARLGEGCLAESLVDGSLLFRRELTEKVAEAIRGELSGLDLPANRLTELISCELPRLQAPSEFAELG